MGINTLNALVDRISSTESPVELTISNHNVTINPNTGSYFYLDDIDDDITITLNNLSSASSKTIYLRLNFEDDNIVINWPTKIKWQEIAPPYVSEYEDLFISLMTLDGGITWYSEPIIKTKPLAYCNNYMKTKYPSTYNTLTSVPISDLIYFNSIRSTSFNCTFADCNGLTSIDGISDWDTSNVTDLSGTFICCSSLTSLDLSNWDTSNVTSLCTTYTYSGSTSFTGTFFMCSSLNSLNVSTWDTSNITEMRKLFYGCSSLTSLDLSQWDTSNVVYIAQIFSGCSSLRVLDVSNWDTSTVSSSMWAFDSCPLDYLIINSNTVKFTLKDSLSSNCKILVPSSALSNYTSHTAWSDIASQFDAIENYTITKSNGQVTVTHK